MIKGKRSQVEIMGLLIIVILVVMVIFIVISFKAKTGTRTIHKTYASDQMSTSFILALLDTSTTCANSLTIREIISDCATYQRVSCPAADNSCVYLNKSIPSILNDTLGLWGMNYQFKMQGSDFDSYDNFTFSEYCGDNSLAQGASFQIVPLWPRQDSIKVGIKICSN